MTAQVKVGAGMNSFNLFEAERHFKFNISSGIGIMSQLVVVVETIFCIAQSEGFVPFQAEFFPEFKPLHFLTRTNEELHFHLFEFAHTENKLTGNYLISKCFSDLSYTERNFHTTGFLHIEVVYKNTLSSLGAQIDFHGSISR